MALTFSGAHRLPLLWLLALLLAGCAAQSGITPPADLAADTPSQPYPRQSLANLLMAEVAAQRQEFHLASGLYAVEAERLNDPLVSEQAARLAAYIGDLTEAERLARHWHEQEPDNTAALEILVITALRRGDRDTAATRIQQMLDLDTPQGIQRLVLQSQGLDSAQQHLLLELLSNLADQYPRQVPLWHARTLHLQQDHPEKALTAANTGLKLSPDHEELLVQKGNLLFRLERTRAAHRHFTQQLKRHPDSRRLRLSYLRQLLLIGDDSAILDQLGTLVAQHGDDPELLLGISLYAIEKGQQDKVQPALDRLLAQQYRPDDIHYALGHSALQQEHYEDAAEHFRQVGEGPRHMAARINLALALLKNGQSTASRQAMNLLRQHNPDQAVDLYALEASWYNEQQDYRNGYQLLTLGLELAPDHETLLYARAMTAERLKRLDWLENDLRHLLQLNPDNPMALNALGYTLLDRTDRVAEGFALVRQAYALNPEEPAIIDSMGWGYYRNGNLEKALEYLEQAYAHFPDPEVAAHLGEVLWQLGRHQEAERIWQEGLQKAPDDSLLQDTRARLMTGQPQP